MNRLEKFKGLSGNVVSESVRRGIFHIKTWAHLSLLGAVGVSSVGCITPGDFENKNETVIENDGDLADESETKEDVEKDLEDYLDGDGADGEFADEEEDSFEISSCEEGFADCDGDGVCEADLNSVESCGSCDNACNSGVEYNASASGCNGEVCEPACFEGFADCNGVGTDGCEADLKSNDTCGDCDSRCAEGFVCEEDQESETGVSCKPDCDKGWGDCDGDPSNFCEVNLMENRNHCGGCGNGIPDTHECVDGVAFCEDDPVYVEECGGDNRVCTGSELNSCPECTDVLYYSEIANDYISCTQARDEIGFSACTNDPDGINIKTCEALCGSVSGLIDPYANNDNCDIQYGDTSADCKVCEEI